MMDFNKLFLEYKKFIEDNSAYSPRIVKDFTYKSTYFPIITFRMENSIDTYNRTLDSIEYYDDEYFTIMIYSQDVGSTSRNVILDELSKLTQIFMGTYKNMKRTTFRNLPNLDTDVGRKLIQYQCRWDNIYGNIWRRWNKWKH